MRGSGAAALVLIDADEAHDLLHRLGRIAGGDDLAGRFVVFHVAFHDAVQHIIGRQAVLVGLVGTQLGRGRPGDDALGNDLAIAVAPDGQAVDQGLGHVLDDGEAAGHVAVQRAIAGGHLGLVARGQHQAAGLAGQGHQQRAAHPRLDVLFGGVHRQAGELPGQQALEGVHGRADGDVVIARPAAAPCRRRRSGKCRRYSAWAS